MVFLVPVALILGFALGWLVRRRLSLHYKQLWQRAEQLLEDKMLFEGDIDRDQAAIPTTPSYPNLPPSQATHALIRPVPPKPTLPYVRGQWALNETHEGTTAIFTAIRSGFEPRELGRTANYTRFKALYRRDRENAVSAVDQLNTGR